MRPALHHLRARPPDCNYRIGPQNGSVGERRVVGNVYRAGVWSVWNSPEYRALRRVVSSPQRASREPGLSGTFCEGCPAIADTSVDEKLRPGYEHRWEDLYQIDERRHVVRIAE